MLSKHRIYTYVGKKQSMLNALLNLLLFYNKIYAFYVVAVVAAQP